MSRKTLTFYFPQKSPGTTMADWTSLPQDLLQSIAKSLESHFDFLRFRRVCNSWRSSAPLNLRPPPIFCSSVHFHTREPDLKHFLWKRTIFLFKFPAHGETPKFWLVRLDEDEFGKKRFYDPLCWGKILPVVEYPLVLDTSDVHVEELGHQYVKITNIGNDPCSIDLIAFVDVSLCVVDRFTFMGKENNVITFEQNDDGILIFRKFGGEELSTIKVEGFCRCIDFVQFKGKFYATDRLGNTICVDPFSGASFLMAEEFAVNPFAEIMTGQEFEVALAGEEEEPTVGGRFVLGRRFKYLIELCGNLLLVEVEKCGDNVTSTFRCEVFQLDVERKRWDRIVSVGDWILFVGKYCRFSVPAIPGVEGNCVVFIFTQGFVQNGTCEKAFVLHLSSGMIVPLDHRPDLLQLFCPPSF